MKRKFKKLISPSDFGLHNVIQADTKFYFLDFEYAGLDSEAKLAYDFILHPKNQINKSLHKDSINLFFKNINSALEYKESTYLLFVSWWLVRLACSLNNSIIEKRLSIGVLDDLNIKKYISERKSNITKFINIYEQTRRNFRSC